jgi:hypothetical protein
MFIQVISGKVTDEQGMLRAAERWQTDLRPGAKGFLGSTEGVTDDGHFIVLARFESEAAAKANSDRPEQGKWWAEMERNLTDVQFADSADVLTFLGGGKDNAGFVQVMRGRVADEDAFRKMHARLGEFEAAMAKARPDVIGEVVAIHDDGTFTDAVYFSSEAAAREGEANWENAADDAKKLMDDLMAAITVDEYFDLRQPRMH